MQDGSGDLLTRAPSPCPSGGLIFVAFAAHKHPDPKLALRLCPKPADQESKAPTAFTAGGATVVMQLVAVR